jgi:hypothetical protein
MALLSCLCLLCSFTVNYKVLTAAEWCRWQELLMLG